MKKLILIILFIGISSTVKSQFSKNDSLFVGKRGNVIWDRKIHVFNLGNEEWTSYYRIYFKRAGDTEWHKVRKLGANIFPYLKKSDTAMSNFYEFKRHKKQSYVLLLSAITILTGWMFYTAHELNRTNDISTYIKPIPLTMLAGFEVCFYLGKRKNTKGDLKLIQAVRLANTL